MPNNKLSHILFFVCALAFRKDQAPSIVDLDEEDLANLELDPFMFLKSFYNDMIVEDGTEEELKLSRMAAAVLFKLNSSMPILKIFKDYKSNVALALEQKGNKYANAFVTTALNHPAMVSTSDMNFLEEAGELIRFAVESLTVSEDVEVNTEEE